jgi:hypothetical protein
LDLEHYGWTEQDLNKEFHLGPGILPRFMGNGKDVMTLKEIIDELKRMYCAYDWLRADAATWLIPIDSINPQAAPSVSNTFISRIEHNVTGFENALRFHRNGSTLQKRSE